MDISDLRIFEAVARLGGMNRAAAVLNTVQSNVTARVRTLEDELGMALFVRHSRGVDLTPAGRRLLPYAERIAHLIADAGRAARDDGVPAGPLALGSLETTAALRLSAVLAAYVARHPKIDLVLRTGTTCELIEAVLARELEGAFVCGPVDHPDLDEEAIFREELALLTAPGVRSLDALARAHDLRIVVLRAGCSYRQRLEDILARRGIVNLRRLEFGTLEAILACVAAGMGITLLPKAIAENAAQERQIAIHAVPARDATVATVFVRRKDSYVSSALAAFLEVARPDRGRAAAE